ncbi:hypothetical protein GuL6_033 [Buttiauxella phage vB_ButM_GuL6]|nr:hypothetical protein GuL6_033 [Buttiauxella phage vB_ButM_GuL6]
MNVLNNPYNEVLNPELDFSESYFDAVVGNVKNKGLLVEMLKSGKNDVEGSVDFLWNFLPIDPGFKVGCNVEQAKNVLRYLIKKA